MKKSVRGNAQWALVCAMGLALGACSDDGANADGAVRAAPKFFAGLEFTIQPQGLLADTNRLRNGALDAVAVQPGGSALLIWSVANADPGPDACTLSGTLPAGLSPLQPANNAAGISTGALTAAGTYFYTLECSGPGGVLSETRSLIVSNPGITLSVSPEAISINDGDGRTKDGIPADGVNILDQDQSKITWSSLLVENCVAAGAWADTGTPTNNVRFRQNLTGLPLGPFNTAGVRTFTLNCTSRVDGSAVSDSVNLTVATDAPSLDFNLTPTLIRAGTSALLTWTTTNVFAGSPAPCTASGNAVAVTPTWTGGLNLPTTDTLPTRGLSTGVINAPGVYNYTYTCSNPSGVLVSKTVQLTVLENCGLLDDEGAGAGLIAPPLTAVTVSSGASCVSGLCDVESPLNVINASLTDFATMSILLGVDDVLGLGDALGLNSTPQITVNSGRILPARRVGFIVRSPAAELVGVNLLQNLTIRTLSDTGAPLESSAESGIDLDVLGLPLLDGEERYFVSFVPTQEFRSARIEFVGILAAVLPELEVYGACVGVP